MKKNGLSLYYITLMLILQVFGGLTAISTPVSAISEEQKTTVSSHCEVIKDNLKEVQRNDSRARVYLGRYYEAILSKFIVPLNIRLVENNLSGTSLIRNQNDFNQKRTEFVADYIEYQKSLEELVLMDCKAEPEKFYDELGIVRTRRAAVSQDVKRLLELSFEQVSLVRALELKL